MTVYDDDPIPKATRQHPLSVPAKGCKHRQQGGGQFSLHSGAGVLVRTKSLNHVLLEYERSTISTKVSHLLLKNYTKFKHIIDY